MTDSARAIRAIVPIGSLAADAIKETPVYALRFLQSKDSKALLGESYTDYPPESIEVEPEPGRRGRSQC